MWLAEDLQLARSFGVYTFIVRSAVCLPLTFKLLTVIWKPHLVTFGFTNLTSSKCIDYRKPAVFQRSGALLIVARPVPLGSLGVRDYSRVGPPVYFHFQNDPSNWHLHHDVIWMIARAGGERACHHNPNNKCSISWWLHNMSFPSL